MLAKSRQLGWMCVSPTPDTQACAEAGKLDRLVVDPAKTILRVMAESLGDAGASSSQAEAARIAMATILRKGTRTSPAYPYVADSQPLHSPRASIEMPSAASTAAST